MRAVLRPTFRTNGRVYATSWRIADGLTLTFEYGVRQGGLEVMVVHRELGSVVIARSRVTRLVTRRVAQAERAT